MIINLNSSESKLWTDIASLGHKFFFSFLLTANLVYLYQFSHYTTEFVCMAVFSVSFNSSFKIHPKHIDFLFSQTFQSKFSKTWRLVFKCCQKRGDSSYNRDKPKKRVSPISRSYSYSYSVYVRYCLFFLFFYASKCFLSTPWAWSTTVLLYLQMTELWGWFIHIICFFFYFQVKI